MSPVSTPERSSDQRRRILDAALEVLRTEGAAAFTVRRVAQEAGCSTTGVYTWFGGKNGLVEALFVEGFEGFDAATDAPPTFRDCCRAYRAWALDNPTQYVVMFGKAVPDFTPSDEAMLRALSSFEGLLERVRGASTVPIDDEAAAVELAHHVWAVLHGYAMIELAGMAVGELDAAFDRGLERLAAGSGLDLEACHVRAAAPVISVP